MFISSKRDLVGEHSITYKYRNTCGEQVSEIRGRNLEKLKEVFDNMHIYGELIGYKIFKYIKYNKEDNSLSIEMIEDKMNKGELI